MIYVLLAVLLVFAIPVSRNYILKLTGLSASFASLVDKVEAEGERLIQEITVSEQDFVGNAEAKARAELQRLEASKLVARLEALIAKLKKFLGQ